MTRALEIVECVLHSFRRLILLRENFNFTSFVERLLVACSRNILTGISCLLGGNFNFCSICICSALMSICINGHTLKSEALPSTTINTYRVLFSDEKIPLDVGFKWDKSHSMKWEKILRCDWDLNWNWQFMYGKAIEREGKSTSIYLFNVYPRKGF